MNIQSKVALITGASSGIGAGVATLLAANGVKVGLAARRADKLKALLKEIQQAGGEGLVVEMDVVDPASVKKGASRHAATAYSRSSVSPAFFASSSAVENTFASGCAR